jgi:CHAD domain-containing protein
LVEVATIRQLRRKRQFRDGSTRVELSLDEVDVVTGKRVVARFVELEAELTKGDATRLAALDATFASDPALRRSVGSKFEAALAALRGETLDDGDAPVLAPSSVLLVTPEPEVVPVVEPEPEAPPTAEPEPEAAAEPIAEPTATEPAADAIAAATATEAAPATTDESASGAATAAPQTVVPKPKSRSRSKAAAAAAAATATDGTAESVEAGAGEATEEGADADVPRLPLSKTAGVLAEDHIAEAGRKVLRFHLARMLAREAGTRTGTDPEDLHSMRVATRRQRAAWRVFGGAFRVPRTKRFRNGLREIAARLGAVRDLDVLLEAADRYRADLPVAEQRALEPLLADWRNHREDARVLLLRELDSEGYKRWVDDYRDFVRTEGAAVLPVGPVQPHRVRDTAPSRVWAAYEVVRGYEPVLRWADVETLHDLRIAAKWLRYSLEFVREALGDDSAPLIAKVTALQDHLGEMHDADVSASMARAFLVAHAGELSALESASIGRYLVSREREVARLRRTLGLPWRGVAGLPFRRALGRVVAGL